MENGFLYNNLPEAYRILDVDQKLILKRFLEAIEEGGVIPVLDSIIEFANVNNVDELNEDQLRLLGSTFGYEYSYSLPLANQRKLIKNIVEIYKRKGTNSSIVYVAKEITEFDAQITPLVNKMFRTWSNKKHYEIPGYEISKTFNNFGDTNAHHFPGRKFTKTNILLKLLPLFDIGLQFERSMALLEVLKMLLPVYTKAFLLLSHTEKDPEVFDSDIQYTEPKMNVIMREFGLPIWDSTDDLIQSIKFKIESDPKVLTKIEQIVDLMRILPESETKTGDYDDYDPKEKFKLTSPAEVLTNGFEDSTDSLSSFKIVETEPKTLSKSEVIQDIITLALEEFERTGCQTKVTETNITDSIPELTTDPLATESDRRWRQSTSELENPFSVFSTDSESKTKSFTDTDLPLSVTDLSDEVKSGSVIGVQFNKLEGEYAEYNSYFNQAAGAKSVEIEFIPEAGSDDWARVVQRSNGDSKGYNIRLYDNYIWAQFKEYGVDYNVRCDDNYVVGQKYHIMACWDGNVANAPYMFVNGVLQTGQNGVDEAGDGGGSILSVARRAAGDSQYINGTVIGLAIWERALLLADAGSRDSVRDILDPHVDPDADWTLIGLWKFEEGTGSTVADPVWGRNLDLVNTPTWIGSKNEDSNEVNDITYKVYYASHSNAPTDSALVFALTGMTSKNTTDEGGDVWSLIYEFDWRNAASVDYVKLNIKRGTTLVAQSQEISVAGTQFVLTEQNSSGISGTVDHSSTWTWIDTNGTITLNKL